MTSTVWNPNLFAVAGIIISACGLGLLGKAVLSSLAVEGAGARRAAAKTRVDLGFAAPMTIAGLVILAAAQFITSGLNPMLTGLLLVAAFGLLLYGLLEGSLVEAMLASPADTAPATRLKLISPPVPAASPALDVMVAGGDDAHAASTESVVAGEVKTHSG